MVTRSLCDGVAAPINQVNVLRIAHGLVSCFICTFEFTVLFLSFWDRLMRARSFYPKQRISSFEGLQEAKPGIGRHLRLILVFKFEEPMRMALFSQGYGGR